MKTPKTEGAEKKSLAIRFWRSSIRVYKKLWFLSIPLTLFFLFISVLYYSVLWGGWGTLPQKEELKQLTVPIASEIYSADQVLMGKYYIQDRTRASYDDLSPDLISALISTEDSRYFQHHGVDIYSLFRVFIRGFIMGDESAGGGSTLSQQLAKNLYPRKSYQFLSLPVNKIREMIIARRLERIYSKQQILAQYLNTVPFGENAFGIASASSRFFSTSPAKLKTEQAALLVGMLKAPSTYNPLKNPGQAKQRRNLVLEQMGIYKLLDKKKLDSLKTLEVGLDYRFPSFHDGIAPYFREHLRQELSEWAATSRKPDGSPVNIYTDGLKIYTTIDSRLQELAEESVREHMQAVQKLFYKKFKPLKSNHPAVQAAKKRTQHYKSLEKKGWNESQIDSAFRIPYEMKIFDWDQVREESLSVLDSIRHYQRLLRAGFIVLEPKTGKVRAWVGGPEHHYFQFDHVTAKRQTGSVFKPIVFASAIEKGISPCDYIPNDKIAYAGFENWHPKNSDRMYGGEYSMQGALAYSVNIAAVNLFLKVEPKYVIATAKKMGIESPLPEVPSLALGTADLTLKEMASTFSTIINGGYYNRPAIIKKIVSKEGYVLFDASLHYPKAERVLKEETSQKMIELLKGVVRMGTARSLTGKYGLPKEMVGKTGTSQDQADGWFIGSTPRLLGAAWVGGDDRTIHFPSLRDGQGARTAMPIWAKFMQKVYADPEFAELKKDAFPKPPQAIYQDLSCSPYTFMVSQSEFKKWWESQNPSQPILIE